MKPACLLFAALVALSPAVTAAPPWVSDQGDGAYKNPVLFADYSDPDVVRVGDHFYLTASSFNCVPALPILHSRDLVNWTILAHAAPRLPDRFDAVQHGNGIWAPSIRHHDGHFWIFVGDPDWGILMTRSRDPAGPWSPLHVVKNGQGLIDPCPLWDDDGKAYLVHAFAKSRAGKNSILVVQEMTPDGRGVVGDERILIDGRNDVHPTIEGPKFYKRNDWYYVFAPAGGVTPGWQLAARSRSVFGPYETRRVLEQGSTNINGPHQGGWVELPGGESWFVHFQDRGAYGRVVHLNPVRWVDDWPAMGEDFDGNGVGEPVAVHAKPSIGAEFPVAVPQTSDEFADETLGLQWQWQGNSRNDWASLAARPGWLRLAAVPPPAGDLTAAANQLLQKLPAPQFTATTVVDFAPAGAGDRAGLVVIGETYAGLMLNGAGDALRVIRIEGNRGGDERTLATADAPRGSLWLRVAVAPEARCTFSYSADGRQFTPLGAPFVAKPGRWMGAKVGLVCQGEGGRADFEWFRIE